MQYAFHEGKRVEAWPGGRGICPACAHETIAKCGDVLRWHWSHFPRRHCDPWWENETEWHRSWKSYFPEPWREVIHEDPITGEKHIADVKTDQGFTLEFQNSPMSYDELRSRESFYDNLIWIVNAATFAPNLRAMNRLPPPDSELAKQLIVVMPPRRNPTIGWLEAMIVTSDYEHEMCTESGQTIKYYTVSSFTAEGESGGVVDAKRRIDAAFEGHQWLVWTRPRDVWLRSRTCVILDPGGDALVLIGKYSEEIPMYCIGLSKAAFIGAYGGKPPNPPLQRTGSAARE